MRFLLLPNRGVAYGQDFLAKSMQQYCALTPLVGNTVLPPTASLVVSLNSDSKEEANVITSLPTNAAVVVHVHCQYRYYEQLQQKNVQRSLSRARIGVTPAQFSTSELSRLFPNLAWYTVYNGVDPVRFRVRTAEERKYWRQQHGIPAHQLLIGFVGRLEQAKGLQILQELAYLLPKTNIHLILQFLAHADKASVRNYAEIAQSIQQSAPSHVSLFPDSDLSADRPIGYFDVLLTPSLSEVCPLVVLEAFTAGYLC